MLTETERDVIGEAIEIAIARPDSGDALVVAVEAILAARLAPVEAERDVWRKAAERNAAQAHETEIALRRQVSDLTAKRDAAETARVQLAEQRDDSGWLAPEEVTVLTERAEAAERALAARDEVIARVRAVHEPIDVYEMPDGGQEALWAQIDAGTAVVEMRVCSGCASHRVREEIEDGVLDMVDGDAIAAQWPCSTIAALDGPAPQPDMEYAKRDGDRCPIAADCDRKPGHPGWCQVRCQRTPDCSDRAGHGGRCSASRWRGDFWTTPPTTDAEEANEA